MRTAQFFGTCLVTLCLGVAFPAQAAYRSSAEQRRTLSLTVYNQNFGLVREVRGLELERGRVELDFGDVARTIQPETVHIRSLAGEDLLRVLEQNYRYDLLNPQKLLEKYVGRSVKVYRWNETLGRDEVHEAEVLAAKAGTILRIGDEITFNYPGRIAFPEIPENLIAKPTLSWLLESERKHQDVEVSYLAGGLNWKADYVFVIDENDALGDLTSWVTLTNHSGATYENAQLKLVAGDVQRVSPRIDRHFDYGAKSRLTEAANAGFRSEGFFEYHLYTLERPTTLRDNEQKQVTLLEAAGVPIHKRLIFYGAAQYYRGSYGQVKSNQKVGVYLDFENSEENQLGMALPKGIVRVYKADSEGSKQFIGEDQIDHTPRDERLRIKMGEAFDVVGDRRQKDFNVIGTCVADSSWEIELRNHKDAGVEVEVFEPVGGDWTVLQSSHPYEKLDAHTFKFDVEVPLRSKEKIEYRIRVRWC